ncbi:MAG: DUF1847 domain-containing protein [Syntrophorhabdales bacterium]|jgi:uncharacterized metal-binding protein
MSKNQVPQCAECSLPARERICLSPEGKGSKGCPTLGKTKLLERARKEYHKQGILEFARQASIQEAECYLNREKKPFTMHPGKPRIQEICEFASKMKYARLGLISCIGLSREAAIVAQILEVQGFEVVSVVCKAGSIPKEEIGVKEHEKIRIGEYEAMCNPIFQAMLVNEAGTDLNVLLGLCVGHDALFFKYAHAPTTVLAVKDRVTGHNPLAAIYNSETFYARLKRKGF